MPTPAILLTPGTSLHGFRVTVVTPVPALRAMVYQAEHTGSGARVLHVHTDDPENLFSITFPTPPPDNTGLPHILEHAVLGGSRRFPVRDPFFEMLEMSMATFLNAMTGSDATYYPVASNVRKDLFNLAEVYFDAVFHPLLSEATFRREGHHLAPQDPERPAGDLTVSGIVYNEMKGAFSNPESRLGSLAMRGLFPDSVYGRESGGDPDAIPGLTYADFQRFYQATYHPANAHIVLYGDIPTADYLAFLGPRLDGLDRRPGPAPLRAQPRWTAPRSLHDSYPIGTDESPGEKTYALTLWLTGDGRDGADVTALSVLGLVLLGNEAAPLRKAIIDAKLGHDLIHSGFSTVGIESVFQVGIRGTDPARVATFERVVADTLAAVAATPLDRARVEAAFQQVAYDCLEVQSMFPLAVMDRVLNAWLYDLDPCTYLDMAKHLEGCRQRYAADPDFLNRLIRERLLGNPHRLTVTLTPDREWQARTEAEFAGRMRQVRAGLSDEQAVAIAAAAAELDRAAGTPDPPEALALLPHLRVADLPPSPRHIRTTLERVGGVDLLVNDVFANGVCYLNLSFDLQGLPAELWPYVPRYCDAIRKLGAAGQGYEQIAIRAAACTGGLSCEPFFSTHATDPTRRVWGIGFNLKTLDGYVQPALELLRDLLFEIDPRDRGRLRDVLVQSRAWYHTELVHQGSHTASRYAASGLTLEGHLNEVVTGLPQLALMDRFTLMFEESAEEVVGRVEEIGRFVRNRRLLTASFTGSDAAGGAVRGALAAWAAGMRDQPPVAATVPGFQPHAAPPRTGLAGPVQVAHCATVLPAPHFSDPAAPLLTLGAHLLDFDYLLTEIRLKGNAYGAWCDYNPLGQSLSLGSYRDPHVTRTLEVFAAVPDHVRQAEWTQADVDRAIIATAKHDERPIRPGAATSTALHRYLAGITPEVRERRHACILAATVGDVQETIAGVVAAGLPAAATCVVSNRAKLEEANRQMGPAGALQIRDILPS